MPTRSDATKLTVDLIKSSEAGSKKLLIALHGLGDSMEGYRWLPRALNFPWLNVLLVNAPDSYYGGFSSYDFAGDAGAGIARSCRMLDSLISDLEEQGFDPAQMLLFGFSQGCLMCITLGVTAPKRFAGIIGVSGYVHGIDELLKRKSGMAGNQRFLITHGTKDPLLRVELVRDQIKALQAAGLSIEWREFPKVHTIIEEEIELFRSFVMKSFSINQ